METKKTTTSLTVQIDSELRKRLEECARREERTLRVIVERALKSYIKKSLENEGKGDL